MHGFENVRHELDAKRQQLQQDLQAAQGRVDEIHADLERVHEALEALGGPKRKSKTRAPRPGKKPGPSVADVQRHIARVREEKPFASAHELQKDVRALVRKSGVSLSGFPRLFAQALVSSPGFSAGQVDTRVSSGSHDLLDSLESTPSIAPGAREARAGEDAEPAHETSPEKAPADSSDENPFVP